MEDVSDQKRIYELWWKYLQQSDDYKKWLETYSKKYVNWDAWWGTHIEAKDDEKLKHVLKSNRFDPKWTTLYDLWGRVNIHTVSFDEWWKRKKSRMDNKTPIDYYVNWAGYEVNYCWINMKKKPSDLEELEKQFRTEFVERMKESPNLYIIVNPDGNLKTLKARLGDMVKQKKKEKQDFYTMTKEYSRPIAGKIRIDELEKYLNVFILKERSKKGWKEIISVVSPGLNWSTYEDGRRIHERYLQNAKKIIRNVENGRFPGNYTTPDR